MAGCLEDDKLSTVRRKSIENLTCLYFGKPHRLIVARQIAVALLLKGGSSRLAGTVRRNWRCGSPRMTVVDILLLSLWHLLSRLLGRVCTGC